jgi:hypothetical protein
MFFKICGSTKTRFGHTPSSLMFHKQFFSKRFSPPPAQFPYIPEQKSCLSDINFSALTKSASFVN